MILDNRKLATLRGALLFWKEEMCPSGTEVMQPYLEPADIEPLSEAEIDDLRELLKPDRVRYGIFDVERRRLATDLLFLTPEAAEQIGLPDTEPVPIFVPEIPQ